VLTILKNSRVRLIISLGAGFSFGQLIFGAWRDTIGVFMVGLAAMPVLTWGFYLNLTAISAHLESAQETD
jgi:hypothetical protein